MKTYRILLLVFLLSPLMPLAILAQSWEQLVNPLWGGRPVEIHRDVNGNLWANAGTAVFRSADLGVTWVERSPNTTLSFFESLGYRLATLIAPGDLPLIVLYPANGTSTTIYASFTSGTSWQEVPMPDQFNGQPLYITGLSNGTGLAFVGDGSGTLVMVSSNGGSTWTLETTLGSRPEKALEANDGALYCIEPNDGVIRMRSVSGEWSTIATPGSGSVGNLAVSRNQLLVTASSDSSYVTTDNGNTWRAQSLRLPNMESSISNICGLQDGSFIGSARFRLPNSLSQFTCWRLPEGANEWVLTADSLNHEIDNPLALDARSFMAVDNRGPVLSVDGGATFEFRTRGLAMHFIWRHAISPSTVVACTISGDVFRISQDGGDWENVTQYPRSRGDFPAFDVVHAGNDVFLMNTRSGVQRSSDAGRTWQPVDVTSNVAYHEFAAGPNNSIYIASRNEIFRTTNGGVSWEVMYTAPGGSRPITEVSVAANGRVFFSTGRSVHAVDGGTATLLRSVTTDIGLLRTSPWNPQLLAYVEADEDSALRTISVSTDGGVNWRDVVYAATPGSEPPAFDAILLPSGQYIVSSIDGLTTVYAPDAEVAVTEPVQGIEIPMSLLLDGSFYYRARNSYIEYRPYPTSVQQNADEHSYRLFAHPQPAKGTVTISGTSLGAPLVVFDARGVVVATSTADDGETTLTVDGLAAGVYVVRSGMYSVAVVVY